MPEVARSMMKPEVSPKQHSMPQEHPIVMPRKRLLTPFEAIVYPIMIGTLVWFGGMTVTKHNEAYALSVERYEVKAETASWNKQNEELTYEIAQLSSPERIYAIAEKFGMKFNENNVKVINQ